LANNGKLIMPEGMGDDYQLDYDWITTTANKYKPKTEHA
jgi:hypothetical protein